MNGSLRGAVVAALLLGNSACATNPAGPVFDPDPVLHPPGSRVVFNRMCADEDRYRVKAYARMESPDGRAQAVVAVLAGYRATGGRTVFVDVRLQRLRLDAGDHWRDTSYTIRLVARSDRAALEGPEAGSFVEDARGERRFRTDRDGTADWITFVEPADEVEGSERFHRFAPEIGFKAPNLDVEGPRDEFDLGLSLRNEANARTLQLLGPRVRIPERLWDMVPPAPATLGLMETLNPGQDGGLFDVLGRAWKYRKCIEERRAAKGFLGPYATTARTDDEI